jgi:hypothetical protein
MTTAATLVLIVQIWGIIGAGVAFVFLAFGIDHVDEDARGAYVFRPLLVPGILIIWPLVLWRWWQIETQSAGWMQRYRPVRRSYGFAVIAMTAAILLLVVLGLNARQDWPAGIAPQQISEAGQ